LAAPRVREEVAIATLSAPESIPESLLLIDRATGGARSWIVASAMEQGVKMMQKRVKAMENGKARARNDGTR
jgi:predicted transcriptional regulator